MDTLAALANGFAVAATPYNLLWAVVGVTIGTAIGALPGLGPSTTVALLMPLTYNVSPTAAFIMFAGIYYGSQYGGSTASILLNTPGEPGSMMTAVEGNAMARRGRGAQALATAAIGSFVAGTLGTIALTFVAPLMVQVALMLGAPEYFALMVLALAAATARHRAAPRPRASRAFDRAAARLRRPRPAIRPGALHLRHHGTARRDRRDDRRRRPLRGGRDPLRRLAHRRRQGRDPGRPRLAVDEPGGLEPLLESVAARRRLRLPDRRAARRRRRSPDHAVLRDREAPLASTRRSSATAPSRASPAPRPPTTPPLPARSLRSLRSACRPPRPPRCCSRPSSNTGCGPGPLLFTSNPELVWGMIASLYIGNVLLLVLNLPLVGIWVRLLTIPKP